MSPSLYNQMVPTFVKGRVPLTLSVCSVPAETPNIFRTSRDGSHRLEWFVLCRGCKRFPISLSKSILSVAKSSNVTSWFRSGVLGRPLLFFEVLSSIIYRHLFLFDDIKLSSRR